jgi:hypothetical protein
LKRLRLFFHYLIRVLPIAAETWKAGNYIFAVSVDRAGNKGQTLTSVLID